MSSIAAAASAIFYSDYALDTEGREAWTDEVTHRAVSLIDIPVSSLSGILTVLPLFIIGSALWMTPRRLFNGVSESLSQWSFTPLEYECAVLSAYPLVWTHMSPVYFSQAIMDIIGVGLPSVGAYGRNVTHGIFETAQKELEGEPEWSWRPGFDLLAEATAHAGFYRA